MRRSKHTDTRAAIYARFSTTRQSKEGYSSCDAQEAACRTWAQERSYSVAGVWRDEGETGTKLTRRGWVELLAAAQTVAQAWPHATEAERREILRLSVGRVTIDRHTLELEILIGDPVFEAPPVGSSMRMVAQGPTQRDRLTAVPRRATWRGALWPTFV